MFKTGEEIIVTKEWILKNISQEDIYEAFLGFKPIVGARFNSPFRADDNPSCSFKWFNGKLMLRDFGINKSYDCFNVAGNTLGEAMNNIAIKFGLRSGQVISKINPSSIPLIANTTKIEIRKKEFSKEDLYYWSKYNISLETLKLFNVSSVAGLWINEKNLPISTPCFSYYFGNGNYKILQPNSKDYKWISNCNSNKIQGYQQLPESGNLLILTKALKDVMCFYELGFNAVALQSETSLLSIKQYEHLTSRFSNIILNYDFDYAGISTTNRIRSLYNIPFIFLTNGKFKTLNYEAKDISDYIKIFGINQTIQLLKYIANEESSRLCYSSLSMGKSNTR